MANQEFLRLGISRPRLSPYRIERAEDVSHRLLAEALLQDSSCLAALLDSGHNPNAMDKSGQSAGHRAAEDGLAEHLDLLLKAGLVPDTPDAQGNTPAHLAAVGRGHIECLKLLAHRLADFRVKNLAGQTVMDRASKHSDAWSYLKEVTGSEYAAALDRKHEKNELARLSKLEDSWKILFGDSNLFFYLPEDDFQVSKLLSSAPSRTKPRPASLDHLLSHQPLRWLSLSTGAEDAIKRAKLAQHVVARSVATAAVTATGGASIPTACQGCES